MRVFRAWTLSKKYILAYLLLFLLSACFPYFVWVTSKTNLDEFLIQGPNSFTIQFVKVRCREKMKSDKRLQWYGIAPLQKDFKGLYAKECDCEFYPDVNFSCKCGWNKRITIAEHGKFQDLRILSKSGIKRVRNWIFWRKQMANLASLQWSPQSIALIIIPTLLIIYFDSKRLHRCCEGCWEHNKLITIVMYRYKSKSLYI